MTTFFLQILNFNFENIKLIILLIKFIISLHCLLPKNSKLLLKILYTIVWREHFLLLLGFVLYLRKLLLDFFYVISISEEKLCFMLYYYMLNLTVHVIDRCVNLIVKLLDLIYGLFIEVGWSSYRYSMMAWYCMCGY